MARRTGTVEGQVYPESNMVMVIGTGFYDFLLPDFAERRLCYGAQDQLYLMSDGRTGHGEYVVLEAWDGPPEPVEAEFTDTTEITLTKPGIYVSRMTESAASPVLDIPAGTYTARVTVTGRRAPTGRRMTIVTGGEPRPVERVRVQLWPTQPDSHQMP